ncbi:MAG: hypothetical protein KatS3mg109_0015 [Pirellulaceae bacterium]|nr:MAG: hypothetical protein KatS3mg109_0015 [Pirellulaceae bacterium]
MATDPYTKIAATLPDASRDVELDALKRWLRDLYPELDVNGPVVNTLFLLPAAERQGYLDKIIRVLRDYSLLKPLPRNTILSESLRNELLEQQLKEFNLTVQEGQPASGLLRLRFSDNSSRVIPDGSEFTSSGGTAFVSQSYLLRASSSGSSDSRVVLYQKRDNSYEVVLPVTMRSPGVAGNVSVGTAFTSSLLLDGLTSVTAAATFSGGRDAGDISDVINSFLDGRFHKAVGSRDQLVALIRSDNSLGDVKDIGVVGSGDPEMHRDKIKFIPGGGGMVDLYVSSGSFPATVPIVLDAVPISRPDAGAQRYTISVSRDVLPGFLGVIEARDQETGAELLIESVAMGVDTSPIYGESVPTLQSVSHATFSRYQTATITVVDPALDYDPTRTDLRRVSVDFWYQPGIREIQSRLSSRSVRYIGGDILVRAALPCFVSVVIRLRSPSSDQLPDANVMKQAVVSEIFRNPMRGSIYLSDVASAILPYIRPSISIVAVDFYGVLFAPDGGHRSINTRDEISIPYEPESQITSRTAAFYTSTDLVQFTVEQTVGVEIP